MRSNCRQVWRQQSEDCRQRNGGILLTGCRSNCLVGGQTADKCEDSRMKTADSYLVVGQTVWLEVELQTHQWGESRGQTADSTQQKKKFGRVFGILKITLRNSSCGFRISSGREYSVVCGINLRCSTIRVPSVYYYKSSVVTLLEEFRQYTTRRVPSTHY